MAPTKDMNTGMRCIKYLLFLFNLLFVVTGVLMIVLGVTIKSLYHDYVAFLDNRYLPPTTFLIVIGAIVFLVASFGCYGAMRESTCMIMVFAVMLAVIFVLELAAGVAGYVLQQGLSEMLITKLNTSMQMYNVDPHMTESLDFVQSELRCCGLNGPEDWAATEGMEDRQHFPDSCCTEYNETSPDAPRTCKMIYGSGCLKRLEFLIGQSAFLLASAAVAIALLQLLGVTFACSLGRSIRAHKTERERRRQELQEQLINSYSMLGNSDPKKTYPVIYMDQDRDTKLPS